VRSKQEITRTHTHAHTVEIQLVMSQARHSAALNESLQQLLVMNSDVGYRNAVSQQIHSSIFSTSARIS